MRVPFIRGVLGTVLLCGLAMAGEGPVFKSTAVKYAKLTLGNDGAKALVLAFDESNGTGEGYDLIRVIPMGFEHAAQTVATKNAGQNQAPTSADFLFVHNRFEPLELAAFVKAAGGPPLITDRIMLTYIHQRMPGMTNETFQVSFGAQKSDGADTWQLTSTSQMRTAASAAEAPALLIPDQASLKFVARQTKDRMAIELGASMVLDGRSAFILKNGRTPEMTVTVKAANGEVIRTSSGGIGTFSFG